MRGRPRQSTASLELRGTFKANPSRGKKRENEPQPVDDLGDPPPGLPVAVRKAWDEIVSKSHAGTLCRADSLAVEMAARLLAEIRKPRTAMNLSLFTKFDAAIARLGMTPSDRSRVSVTGKGAVRDELDIALEEFDVASDPAQRSTT